MKLQSLSIIFIIIVLPISMVFSAFLSNRISYAELELQYDTMLLNATYDAVKAYQLNTVNNQFGDITNQKVKDIEAAVSTLQNSLTTSFGYSGYSSSVVEEYIPAVCFTTYDGYYIYSPFYNTLTNVGDDDYDKSYSKNEEDTTGLRPYVTYSCQYHVDDKNDFVITYTLDNYITIEGILDGNYHYDYGYLYNVTASASGITNTIVSGSSYVVFDNIYFCMGTASTSGQITEEMKEYVGDEEYSYVKINGTKYYLHPGYYKDNDGQTITATVNGQSIYNIDISAGIFYIDSNGERNYSQAQYDTSKEKDDEDNIRFVEYYYAIKYNYSAYMYYKSAYEFSSAVLKGSAVTGYTDKAGNEVGDDYKVLKSLTWEDAVIWDESDGDTTSLQSYASEGGSSTIFDSSASNAIQCSTSNFNEHRKAIIRYTIETNLVSAISSFSSSKGSDFVMPKISEDDWEIIENDVCTISFMQGMNLGSKQYNGYAVVANTLTNDYVDENDIYILAYDNSTDNYIYCKPNDGTISGYDTSSSVEVLKQTRTTLDGNRTVILTNTYSSGIWKINFETKQYATTSDTIYYIPASYKSSDSATGMLSYYGSYTSIYGSYNVNAISTGGKKVYFNGSTTKTYTSTDMYTYMNKVGNSNLKYAYYYGLGRERFGSFNVNNVNIELYGNNNVDRYFFKNLTVTIN